MILIRCAFQSEAEWGKQSAFNKRPAPSPVLRHNNSTLIFDETWESDEI